MGRLTAICVIVVVGGLCACTTSDPKIKGAVPNKVVAAALSGTWQCTPEYSSKARHGLLPASVGPDNLEDVFSDFVDASEVRSCGTATLVYEATPKLTITYERNGVLSKAQDIDAKHGLRVADDGTVELVSKSCGSDLGVGCVRDSYRLFVDDSGRLVVVEKSMGAGIAFLILPLLGSDSRMARFAPKVIK